MAPAPPPAPLTLAAAALEPRAMPLGTGSTIEPSRVEPRVSFVVATIKSIGTVGEGGRGVSATVLGHGDIRAGQPRTLFTQKSIRRNLQVCDATNVKHNDGLASSVGCSERGNHASVTPHSACSTHCASIPASSCFPARACEWPSVAPGSMRNTSATSGDAQPCVTASSARRTLSGA